MRPRINSFGKIYFKDLDSYLYDNQVYGFTVKINENTLTYSYNIMFRKNKEAPEMLYVEVSQSSKFVLAARTNKGIQFNNVEEVKKYTKK